MNRPRKLDATDLAGRDVGVLGQCCHQPEACHVGHTGHDEAEGVAEGIGVGPVGRDEVAGAASDERRDDQGESDDDHSDEENGLDLTGKAHSEPVHCRNDQGQDDADYQYSHID